MLKFGKYINDNLPAQVIMLVKQNSAAPVPEWLRPLITLSTLNRSSSHRCGFKHSSGHMLDKPSSACGWPGGLFWGSPVFATTIDSAQNEWNNLDGLYPPSPPLPPPPPPHHHHHQKIKQRIYKIFVSIMLFWPFNISEWVRESYIKTIFGINRI